MKQKADRKALLAQYKQTRPDAGIYRIINGITGAFFLGSDTDINSVAGKMDFARITGTYSILPGNLGKDAVRDGIENFTLEILDRVPVKLETTRDELKEELDVLETLWREKLRAEALPDIE